MFEVKHAEIWKHNPHFVTRSELLEILFEVFEQFHVVEKSRGYIRRMSVGFKRSMNVNTYAKWHFERFVSLSQFNQIQTIFLDMPFFETSSIRAQTYRN
jgi:hypothetical protein